MNCRWPFFSYARPAAKTDIDIIRGCLKNHPKLTLILKSESASRKF